MTTSSRTQTSALSDEAANRTDLVGYFDRIGVELQSDPTVDLLHDITWRHQLAMPFENLDIVRYHRPIKLDRESLIEKLVYQRRGGYCYEQNGLLAIVLNGLGFRATLGYATWITQQGDRIAPFDHLVLQVSVPGKKNKFLADVGFGKGAPARAISLVAGHEEFHPETGRSYRVSHSNEAGYQWRIDKREDDEDWSLLYDLDLRPRAMKDYEHRNHCNQTLPDSHFTHGIICSRPLPGGRVTIADQTLVRTHGSERVETPLGTDKDLRQALHQWFQITESEQET